MLAVSAAAAAAATHLDRGNGDATAELEVPINSAPVSPSLKLEGKEAEEKGTEPELDHGGVSETVAAYNAGEEVDHGSDTEDAAPIEVPPLPRGWEELIDEVSGMTYYLN